MATASVSVNKSGTWTASLDCDELKVNGQLTFPTTGYTATLTKKVPQGINPTILLLELSVLNPKGITAKHVVTQPVSYEEHTTVHYQEVAILPDGIKIKVNNT